MFYEKAGSCLALLGLLVGCQGSDTAAPTPRAALDNVIVTAGLEGSGRTYTTAEGIVFLETYARENPGFLDQPRAYTSEGVTRSTTFRSLLNALQDQPQIAEVSQPQKLFMDTFQVTNPSTQTSSGTVNTNVPVGATMSVSPAGTYDTHHTLTVHNIGSANFDLNFSRPHSSSFPWASVGSVQSPLPTTYNIITVHTASNASLGSTSAQSTGSNSISAAP